MLQVLLRPNLILLLFLISFNGLSQVQLTNLPTLWITTNNNASISSKERWVPGQLSTLSGGSEGIYNGEIEIRGRGNSTWGMDKKPYRMRLKEKYNLLGLPAKERNWVLLANYADKSLLRNAITFEMSQFIGMPFSNHYKLVDVYINGNYQGNYTLTDHVQVADTRIIAESLKDTDTQLPQISGGYLLEIDGFAHSEPVHFYTSKQNVPITVKHPDEESINTQQRNYIKQYIDNFEDALFSNNYTDPVNGYAKFVDMNSLVNWYIACELSTNPDAYWSTYLVKRRNDDKIYFGPLWDFDIAYHNDHRISNSLYRHMSEVGFGYKSWIQRLLTDDRFRIAVRTRWNELKSQGMKNHLLSKLDQRIEEINDSQIQNFQKWNILNTKVYNEPEVRGSYANEVGFLRNFISQRFDWLDQEINGFDTNFFYKITQRATGKSLTINDNKTVQKTYTDSDTFQWQMIWLENSTFQVINKSNGLALQGFPSGSGQLELREIDPSNPGQQWILTQSDKDNTFRLTNRYGFSMDNYAGFSSENNPVTQFTKTVNHRNQEWIFTKTDNINVQDCDANISVSASKNNATCNEPITLTAQCIGDNCDGYTYKWTGNGVNITGGSAIVNHTTNGNFTYVMTAQKEGCRNVSKPISINISGCNQSPSGTLFSQCSEAEVSPGTGEISNDANASGGKTRGHPSQPNYFVDYSIQNVPADGIYKLTLRYSAERPAEVAITANGGSTLALSLVPTHSWNIVFTEIHTSIYLRKGSNTVKVQSIGTNSVRQDKICVEGIAANEEIEVPQPECNFNINASASNPLPGCGESVNLTADCSGPDCNNVTYQWSGNNLQATGNSASVSHNQNGTYSYTVTASKSGCEIKSKTVEVQVTNCTVPNQCDFNINASASNPLPGCGESVNLTANCSGPDCNNVSYQWSGNNLQATGNSATVSHNQNGTYSYTVTASKSGCTSQTNTVTVQVTGCSTGGQPVSFNQCIEAEASEGSGAITDDPNASAGRTRGTIQQPSHYVDYKINNVPANGTFKLKLRYSSNAASQVKIRVNDSAEQTVNLSPTHSWNIVFNEATFNINLNAGNNTVRISGVGNNSTRQDKICIEGTVSTGNPEPPTCNFNITATASKTNLICNESIQLTANCQGDDCNQVNYNWTGNNINVNNRTTQVSHNSNGTYTYKVVASKYGCSSIEKTVTVNVSGCGGNTPEQPVAYNACIEAENSGGNGSITDDPNASNGRTRGTTGNPTHYVDYQINNVPASGIYRITLRYSSENHSEVKATVNGSETIVPLTATHSWNIVFTEKSFNVTLAAGNNTLRIQGMGNSSTRQDKICVENTAQNLSARMISDDNIIPVESLQQQELELTLSPNPAVSYVNAAFYLANGEKATVVVHDMYGQTIYVQKITGTGNKHTETIQMTGQKPGVYLLRLQSDKQNHVKKLILIP